MHESDVWRVALLATDYDALPFIQIGRYGPQPILMPHKVYPWRDDAIRESRKHQPSSPPRRHRS
jgi:hypothetical protein